MQKAGIFAFFCIFFDKKGGFFSKGGADGGEKGNRPRDHAGRGVRVNGKVSLL